MSKTFFNLPIIHIADRKSFPKRNIDYVTHILTIFTGAQVPVDYSTTIAYRRL